MLLEHAMKVLAKNGLISEAEFSDFMRGEKGGEQFYDLPNEYTYTDAKKYFAGAFDSRITPDADEELLDRVWFTRVRSADKVRFERTYKQFEKYQDGEPLKLYRGIVMLDGKEIDLDDSGVCWTFNPKKAKVWAEDAYEKAVTIYHADPDKAEMYVLTATTDIDNARLPYSFWLAGRFERAEYEVRLKHNIPKDRIKYKRIPKGD